MILLGLASRSQIGLLERNLLGSREWTKTEHGRWEERLCANSDALPMSIVRLCGKIKRETREADGFRRRAVAALLYRYFAGMQNSLGAVRNTLRPGEHAVFIVGNNRTRGATGEILIETPELLADVAQAEDYQVEELIPLETWPRFGLHHANGIGSEAAVWLVAT